MDKIKELSNLAVDHPYYCNDINCYSNDAREVYETMTEFLDCFEDADVDMNLCFRWDIKNRSEDEEGMKAGRYYAEVFLMLQRKGIYKPCVIKHINEEETIRFKKYAEKHWEKLKDIWKPIS
tara:strand:+ start:484 stop:849 length:366 start_codon:yes stop_codon:yes gene_type:complete